MRLAILDGILKYTDDPSAREPDWGAFDPLRFVRIAADALVEIIKLHRAWFRSEKGGRRADLRGAYLLTGEQVFALFEAIHAGETDRVKLAALVGEESLSPRRAAKATTLLKNADFILFDSGDRVWKSLLPGAKV